MIVLSSFKTGFAKSYLKATSTKELNVTPGAGVVVYPSDLRLLVNGKPLSGEVLWLNILLQLLMLIILYMYRLLIVFCQYLLPEQKR